MLILFTVVLLGALARKLHLMNDAFDALLSKLVMTVALPGMILNSVLGNTNLPDSNTILMLLVCSTVLYFFICLFAWVLFVCVGFRACGVSGRAEAGAGCACVSHIVRKYGLYRLCGVGRHHGE